MDAAFNELAGRIHRLYLANRTEWLRLTEQGFVQEADTKGPVRFMSSGRLDLPGMIARLTCLCNTVLRSSTPIIEYEDYLDHSCTNPYPSIAYCCMLAAAKDRKPSDIVQVEAWLDEVVDHFGVIENGPHEISNSN